MKIVIPMSGFGERFKRAGYRVPKPLIEVEGKPIIAHVLDMFPGETDFVFICNQDHLAEPEYLMREILQSYCPTGTIVAIPAHKLGPVYAVTQALAHIGNDEPVIVNYCDFTCVWDYAAFKAQVSATGCDGAIAAYNGFHPHMLESTSYAFMRESDGRVTAIQEKQPYTDTPMQEFASSGTYYFASGALMREAFARTVARDDLKLNGEYYVSLAYRPLLEDGRRIDIFEIIYFIQWGTPEDLAIYNSWSRTFKALAKAEGARVRQAGAVQIPMVGMGSRFAHEGYTLPKPLIPVSGQPMVLQATGDLPQAPRTVFVLRKDLPHLEQITAVLAAQPGGEIRMLDGLTDGQARTCLLGLDGLDPEQPLTIGACDNGAVYEHDALERLLVDSAADVIVWGARGYPGAARKPQMYSWIDADAAGTVRGVSVKTPLADPKNDPIVIGAFTFRRLKDFAAAAERMIARNVTVNGEYYVDAAINDAIALGLNCRLFEIEAYLCWGTPDDLKTFEYWQGCFHKWPPHPYSLQYDKDGMSCAPSNAARK